MRPALASTIVAMVPSITRPPVSTRGVSDEVVAGRERGMRVAGEPSRQRQHVAIGGPPGQTGAALRRLRASPLVAEGEMGDRQSGGNDGGPPARQQAGGIESRQTSS